MSRSGPKPKLFYIASLDKKLTAKQIEQIYGIPTSTVYERYMNGNSVEREAKRGRPNTYIVEYEGEQITLRDLAVKLGLKYPTMLYRYHQGLDPTIPLYRKHPPFNAKTRRKLKKKTENK